MAVEYIIGIGLAILAYIVGLFTQAPGQQQTTDAPAQQPPQVIMVPQPATPAPAVTQAAGYGSIVNIWCGTAENRPLEAPDEITLSNLGNVFFAVLGQKVGEVQVGVYVDNAFIKQFNVTIAPDDIGNTDTYSFNYPAGFKQPGEHTIEICVAPDDGTLSGNPDEIPWANGMTVPIIIP